MNKRLPLLKTILLVGFLAGCSTPPLIDAADTLSGLEGRITSRSASPFTRSKGGTPMALIGTSSESLLRGKSGKYGTFRISSDELRLNARMIDPDSMPGIQQRYNNDCGQAAMAMVLDYYGIEFEGKETYEAVTQTMPPMAWGTRIEDVTALFENIEGMGVAPVRQASIEYLQQQVAQGKPVPVVISIQGITTLMHYLVVLGVSTSSNGSRIILYKDPANPEGVGYLDEATFLSVWDNAPIRSSWWSGLASFMANTNPANYERVAFDIGEK